MQIPFPKNSRLSRFSQGLADAPRLMNPHSPVVKVAAALYVLAAIAVQCLWSSPMTTLVAFILLLCGSFWLLLPDQIEQIQAEIALERLAP